MIVCHESDEMTPVERWKATETGQEVDRILCIPGMGEFKTQISNYSIWDMWHDANAIANIEIVAYKRFGHDQLMIGPNSYGIADAMGAKVKYSKEKLPYIEKPVITDLNQIKQMEPIDAGTHPRIQLFRKAAGILEKEVLPVVPVVASVGGPFTIASYLRGAEFLLRDCNRHPESVHRLLRVVTDSEISCIRTMSEFGFRTAFADPVANAELLGPKYYREFAYPYMKELAETAYKVSGKKPYLHMCGKTYKIWNYFREYDLGIISLDNIIDLDRARKELADSFMIAGNVPPVDVVMNGTERDIEESVRDCIEIGKYMPHGYILSTGCEIPYGTAPEKVDCFMKSARCYGHI